MWSRLFTLAALVGVLGGGAAAGLEWALHWGSHNIVGRFVHNVGGGDVFAFHWAVLLLPALGGLASGIAMRLLCPDSVGHGTELLTRAFHHDLGRFSLRGPLVKAIAAIGVISCGGSAGPEGPIAALGAALGSSTGRLFGLTPKERRILLVAGCGAGVGAIFQCPLGGALFAAGVLYREPEFESDAMVPAFVASVIGYSTFLLLQAPAEHLQGAAEHLLTGADNLVFASPIELIPYAVLGVLCGGVSILFYYAMRTIEHKLVPASRLPVWLVPALGGLATGVIACLLPQVMDDQYQFTQASMKGTLYGWSPIWWRWALLFAAVMIGKCFATAFTVGSGGAGGVLGPSLFIGGAAGAAVGAVLEALFPGHVPESLRASLVPVGMGGVLAASMRTPIAALVMVTEMTGSYGLIVPSMLVCMSAYVIGRRWGINNEQVRGSAESPAHAGDVVVHLLETWRVKQVMIRRWENTATPDTPLDELVKQLKPGTRPVFAVATQNKLLGLISVPDIRRIMNEPGLLHAVIASDLMTTDLVTVTAEDDVYQALNVLTQTHHEVLPVVRKDAPDHWVGMLSRERVFEMLQDQIRRMHEHVLREHGGLSAIDREGQLQQLLVGVAPERKELVQRLLVPLQAIGKSLRECDFRKQFDAQIIAIEQPDGTLQSPPDPDLPLHTGLRLVAIVSGQRQKPDETSKDE